MGLYAGFAAEMQHEPSGEADYLVGTSSDFEKAQELITWLAPEDLEATQRRLIVDATRIVEKHWSERVNYWRRLLLKRMRQS